MSRARALPFKCSAVISDVDGTLVTEDKILTSRAQVGRGRIARKRNRFFDYQRRPPRGLRMLIEPLGITTPVIGFNGGVVAATDFSVITEHLLSPESLGARSTCSMHTKCRSGCFSGQDWFVRDSGGPYVGKEERTVGFRPKMVEDFGRNLDARRQDRRRQQGFRPSRTV